MNHILDFNDYLKENYNLDIDDELLNENILSETKDRFLKWWKNFNNKETVLRKIQYYINKSLHVALVVYVLVIIAKFNPGLLNIDNNITALTTISIIIDVLFYILIFAQWSFMPWIGVHEVRKAFIRRKMREVLNRFRKHEYRNAIFSLIGDKKDILKAVDKLKRDGVLSDENIIDFEDIFILDLSGTYKPEILIDNPVINELDPYDEDNWEEKKYDPNEPYINIMSYKRRNLVAAELNKYNIYLRSVVETSDLFDKKIYKASKKDYTTYYKTELEEFKKIKKDPDEYFNNYHKKL